MKMIKNQSKEIFLIAIRWKEFR